MARREDRLTAPLSGQLVAPDVLPTCFLWLRHPSLRVPPFLGRLLKR